MQIKVTCEGCHRQIATSGPVTNNTLKCPRCGHLQWVPEGDATPATTTPYEYVPGMLGQDFSPPTTRVNYDTMSVPRGPSSWVVDDKGAMRRWAERSPGDGPTIPSVEVTKDSVPPIVPPSRSDLLYWLLFLTLIPLAWSVRTTRDDTADRINRTLREYPEAFRDIETTEDGQVRFEDVVERLPQLPGHRIGGAYLPRETSLHWVYALLTSIGYLGVVMIMFPRASTRTSNLLSIAAFTGTVGIILLFIVQLISLMTPLWVGGGPLTIIFWIIGFSYRAALNQNAGFISSFLGFTFGVGFCEEVIKALPIIWYFRNFDQLSWRGACRWGMASGAGFGIAEGIMYSSDFYNGVQRGEAYLVRFVSCVALHAIWSACVAMTLYRHQRLLKDVQRWSDYILPVLRVIAVPMVLHGIYDTVLKMHWNPIALAVAVISFGWLAWLIESQRDVEKAAAAAAAASAPAAAPA
jgi:RsiW-degrading membrane proteinase PrsW (M82 family)